MKNEKIIDMEQCYSNGDLAAALLQASEFVERIGEEAVHHIFAEKDENVHGAWWVNIVYRPYQVKK